MPSRSATSVTCTSVLIVEDHTDNREMLAEFLIFAGFDVATASSGLEALRVADLHRPDVVLMDLRLEGELDGIETTRRLKAHPALKHSVVVAVTGLAFPKHRNAALEA